MTQSSASDRKSIRAQEKRSAQIDSARGDFVRHMMSSVEGRLYVHESLTSCNIFHSTFNLSPLAMAFAEGQRNTGLQLLNDVMRFAADQYLPMIREANVRHDSNNRSTAPATAGSPSDEQSREQDPGRDDQGSVLGGDYDPYDTGPYEDRYN